MLLSPNPMTFAIMLPRRLASSLLLVLLSLPLQAQFAIPPSATGSGVQQIFPGGVFTGDAFTVVWNERSSSGPWRIRGARVDLAGATTGAIEFPFEGEDQFRPSIAFNGESHFVVWTEGPSGTTLVRGVRLSADGTLLDAQPLTLLGDGGLTNGLYVPRTASVAWSGTDWIVASSSVENAIVGRRFSAAGAPLDDEPVLLTGPGNRRDPQISCGGDDCLLVWRETGHRSNNIPIPEPDTVLAARLRRDLRNARPVEASDASREGQIGPDFAVFDWGRIDVSWNGRRNAWMVAWSEGPGARVVEKDGMVSDPAPNGGFGGSPAALIPQGSGWLIATIAGFQPTNYGPPVRSLGSLVVGWSEGSFAGTENLEIRSVLQTDVARSAHLFLDIVAAPRPLVLVTSFDVQTGQPSLSGYFVDQAPPRRRAVRRPALGEAFQLRSQEAKLSASPGEN
jgi:hypothetical protein